MAETSSSHPEAADGELEAQLCRLVELPEDLFTVNDAKELFKLVDLALAQTAQPDTTQTDAPTPGPANGSFK